MLNEFRRGGFRIQHSAFNNQHFSFGGIFLLHFPSAWPRGRPRGCSALTLSSTVPCAVRTFLPPRPSGRSPWGPVCGRGDCRNSSGSLYNIHTLPAALRFGPEVG